MFDVTKKATEALFEFKREHDLIKGHRFAVFDKKKDNIMCGAFRLEKLDQKWMTN
jgi:hypothetical protein